MSFRRPRTGVGRTNLASSLIEPFTSEEHVPLSINDSSAGVGACLLNAKYAVSTPRRKAHLHAIRTRKFGHFDRAHEESRMHLGDQVMTTSEEDASIKPRSSYSSQNNQQEDRFAGNRNSRARSARGGSARGGMNVSRGVKQPYMNVPPTHPSMPSSRSQPSATTRSKSSIFTDPSSRISLSRQLSGRAETPKYHDVVGRRHTHHHHMKKMVTEHNLSITGHQRNTTVADAVAAGANAAEERLRIYRIEQGGEDEIDHSDTSHAMPRPSYKYGCQLKSQWMDPDNNPIPPSKTYTEYKDKLRSMNLPHISYDIDGDGIVGPEDLFMAKRFDIDGNGVLDREEQYIGKQIIAEQFFAAREAKGDLELFDPEFLTKSKEENIRELADAPGGAFKKRIQELKNIEQNLATVSSKSMKDALTCWNPEIIKHNWFTNKFDVTAWNDFGAPGPRDPNFHLSNDHKGSLDTLQNLRKNKDRYICQSRLDQAKARELRENPWMTSSFHGDKNRVTVAKTSYITNTRIENSPRRKEVMLSARKY